MRTQRSLSLTIVTGVLLFVLPSQARAGAECNFNTKDLLRALGKLVKHDKMDSSGAGPIGCTLWGRLRHGTGWYLGSKFMGGRQPETPATKDVNKKERAALTRVCEPAMESGSDRAKAVCYALVMGTRSIAIGTHSALDSDSGFACGLPLGRLAGFAKSSPLARHAESQWDQEATSWCGPQGCHCESFPRALPNNKRRARRRARMSKKQRLRVLSALSWVGDSASLTWLTNVAQNDQDKDVRKRAGIVLATLQAALK